MTQPLTHRVDGPQGAPVVLLLNGGMMSVSAWDDVAAALAAEFCVVRCDFRGQMLTPALPPPDLAAHVADVVTLLDRLGLERVHVAGTSFGGEVGLLLAARHSDRVRALVAATVVDHPPASMRAIGERLIALCGRAAATGDGREFYDAMTEIVYSPEFRAGHREELAARREALAALPAVWFAGGVRLLEAVDAMDLRAELPRIACPTLVIAAECDALMPLERARAVAAAIGGSELEVYPGCGHALVVEEKERFLVSLQRFLAKYANGEERANLTLRACEELTRSQRASPSSARCGGGVKPATLLRGRGEGERPPLEDD